MRSVLAGLRNLVLPWGARAGRRIVLDGGNAAITVYDAAGKVVATIDANGMKVIGSDGSAVQMATGGLAQLSMTLPNTPGVTYSTGFMEAVEDGTAEHRPYLQISSPQPNTNHWADFILQSAGITQNTTKALLRADTTEFSSFAVANGVLVVGGSSGRVSVHTGGVEETWHPVAFLNGWSNLGGGFVTMQYKKVASPPNFAALVGVMNVGTKTSGAVIGNLPAGYRPINKVRIPVSSNGSNSGGQTPAFDILPSGDITVATGSGFPAAATDCEVCAVFPLDA